jgi:diadenylate cyclase
VLLNFQKDKILFCILFLFFILYYIFSYNNFFVSLNIIESISNVWKYLFGSINISAHSFFYIDIFLVAIIFYSLYKWARNTRIMAILSGFIILGIVFLFAKILDLIAIQWIAEKVLTMLVISIPIIFSDEIKRLLEIIGQTNLFNSSKNDNYNTDWINEIIDLTYRLKEIKWGSLIVLERKTILNEYIINANKINADVNSDLLYSIFNPKSPLHDGAVIIRNKKIAAARCILPISYKSLDKLGTRHRAGLGLSKKLMH